LLHLAKSMGRHLASEKGGVSSGALKGFLIVSKRHYDPGVWVAIEDSITLL
jgi:hypothetical protein